MPKSVILFQMDSYKRLTNKEKVAFYKSLVHLSFAEACTKIGLDKSYAKSGLRTIGAKLYHSIDPDALGISKDVQQMVKQSIEDRKIRGGQPKKEREEAFLPAEAIDPKDNKQVVIDGRNKAAMLLHKKMDRLNKSRKLLDATSITQLATTFGIFFDKAQIIQGQATENIAMMAKIDSNMSPEESLDMILKQREKELAEKNGS